MRLRSWVAAALLAAIAFPATAQRPASLESEDEEKVDRPIRYAAPAREMEKLGFLLGRWTAKETWEEPRRYKRKDYDGYPGPEGRLTRTVEAGPGGFSLLWNEEGRGPMGGYTSRATLAWDPTRRVYVLDRVHSLFPGVVRLTGKFENGKLVLRGEDRWTGEKRSLRLTIEDPGAAGFTETLDAAESGRRERRVVTARFEKTP